MENNNKQQQRKKKKGGIGWLIFLAVIWAINRFDSAELSRFFQRLRWEFRTGRISLNNSRVVAALAIVVLLVVVIVTASAVSRIAKEKRFDGVKARGGGTAEQHSHDRLQGYRGEENVGEHWKKQLDGFLAAGIIDRSEYRVLLERRRK